VSITFKKRSHVAEWVYVDGEQIGHVLKRSDNSYSAIDIKGQTVGHGLPNRDSAAKVLAEVKR